MIGIQFSLGFLGFLLLAAKVVGQLLVHRDGLGTALFSHGGLLLLSLGALGHGLFVLGGQGGSVGVLEELQLVVVVLIVLAVVQTVIGRHDQHRGEGDNDQGDTQIGLNAVAVDIEGQEHHQKGGGQNGGGNDFHLLGEAGGEEHRNEDGNKAGTRHHQLLVGGEGGELGLVLHVGEVAHLVESVQSGVVQGQKAEEQIHGETGIQGDETAQGTARRHQGDELTPSAQTEDHAQHDYRQGGREDEEVGNAELQSRGQEDHESRGRQPDDQGAAGDAAVAEEGRASRLVGGTDDGSLVDVQDGVSFGLLLGAGLAGLPLLFELATGEGGVMLVMLHGACLLRVGLR